MRVVLLRCNQHQCFYRDAFSRRAVDQDWRVPPTLCCYPNEGGKGLRALAKGATPDSGGRECPISRGRLRHQPVLPQYPIIIIIIIIIIIKNRYSHLGTNHLKTYRGVGEEQKIFAHGKIKRKNSCTPINPKKYSCYGLKKFIQGIIWKRKTFLRLENSPPPITFLMGPSLSKRIHQQLTYWTT